MRIAIATTTGFHLIHLARELIALGHDVTYYSYHPLYRMLRGGIPKERARSQFIRLLPWSAGALFRHIPRLQRACVQVMLKRMDERMVQCLEPCDVYIGLSGMLVQSGKHARAKYGACVISDRGSMHVLTQQELLSADGCDRLDASYVSRELDSYAVSDYVVVPSLNSAESFEGNGFPKGRLFVNYYGVDLERFQATPLPDGKFTVLYVGAWSYQKGADILTEVAFRLPDIDFVHVGSVGDLDPPAIQNFKFVGHVPNEELRKFYGRAHLFVLPSRQDGFGMVMLEALACGVPVVASDKTGGADIKGVIQSDSQMEIFEAGSVDELAAAIITMRARIETGPTGGVRHALVDRDIEAFSWKAYAKRYREFLIGIRQ
ncbi:MAG: glycosyltransferase [Lysobacteraceae bacterium]|nr:MAG: glycosyltransferase [Xanthomonadaceae bacterium]